MINIPGCSERTNFIINELLNRKSKATTINEINVNGGKIVGDKNIANEFNKYFSEIGDNLQVKFRKTIWIL